MPGARARSMTKSSAWLLPPTVFSPLKGENTAGRKLFHGPRRPHLHIGGVSPSRPTLTRLVSSEPSGSLFNAAITLAPSFNSDLSAGELVTPGLSGGPPTFFSPSLYLTRRV